MYHENSRFERREMKLITYEIFKFGGNCAHPVSVIQSETEAPFLYNIHFAWIAPRQILASETRRQLHLVCQAAPSFRLDDDYENPYRQILSH